MTQLWVSDIYELKLRSIVPPKHKVWRAVWSHRRKQRPLGEIYKYKSRICADGSQQTYGIDYKETYAPVVSWSTVRILMILSKIFKYTSRQINYMQAFPQAPLVEGEEI